MPALAILYRQNQCSVFSVKMTGCSVYFRRIFSFAAYQNWPDGVSIFKFELDIETQNR
jgi:hypothetical protein